MFSKKDLTQSQLMKKVYRYYNGDDDWRYKAIHAYKKVENVLQWEICPNRGLFPMVWVFDNGRSTACGCGENEYRHPSIYAESIRSVMEHSYNGQSAIAYDFDELRKNWNHWCKTGEVLFDRFNENETRW